MEAVTGHPTVHNVNPKKGTLRIIQAVKNFAAIPGVCHIGLGVTATNNVKVLRNHGFTTEAWATQNTKELVDKLRADKGYPVPISHVIISAPSWVQPPDLKSLCLNYPNIEFVLLNHSGAAYLSIDKFGIRNIRQSIDLENEVHNFRVAANNKRVDDWLVRGLGARGLLLTNLYDTSSFIHPPIIQKLAGTLRIGSFGAGRPWKNQLCAAEAAVQLARQLGVNLELYVNSKRPDGGERMIESRAELFNNLRGCKIVEVPWESWPQFKRTCSTMHLLFSPSFDETFNVVTADGIAVGVTSVTTSAIEWTPTSWWAEPEDPTDIAGVGLRLLHDTHAIHHGRQHLIAYVKNGIRLWENYLMKGD